MEGEEAITAEEKQRQKVNLAQHRHDGRSGDRKT